MHLAQCLAKVMDREGLDAEFAPERSVNPVTRRLASTTKAERLLGFRAEIPLDEGLRNLVDWWRSERVRIAEKPQQEAITP